MKNALFIAGAVALATTFGASIASAQGMQASGNANVNANANTNTSVNTKAKVRAGTAVHTRTKTSAHIAGTRSLARADQVAGTHGAKGRANARLHGSHRTNFCPPGQAKKPGLGSRFKC